MVCAGNYTGCGVIAYYQTGGLTLKSAHIIISALVVVACWSVQPVAAFELVQPASTPLFSSNSTLDLCCANGQFVLTEALVAAGTTDSALNIPTVRVQYDILNATGGDIVSWTLYFDNTLGTKVVAVGTPIGYIKSDGTQTAIGGVDVATLLNNGYGLYAYNGGAPWTVDYQPNHIRFSQAAGVSGALPNNSACGLTDLGSMPSFTIFLEQGTPVGPNAAFAEAEGVDGPFVGVVVGPVKLTVPEPTGFAALAGPLVLMLVVARKRR